MRNTHVPLRIPSGSVVRHNGLLTPDLPSEDRSEDLLWTERPAHPLWEHRPYRADLLVDLGGYGGADGTYRLVVLDPDWDHVSGSFESTDLEAVVATLDAWLHAPPRLQL